MAIHPETSTDGSFVHIEAWAETAFSSLSLSDGPVTAPAAATTTATAVRGTGVSLEIPLDDHHSHAPRAPEGDQREEPVRRALVPRRVSSRDSLKRREALLKGKEGSRRRQRWENDRLLGNPYVQPPLPSDWEARPTHPVHSVPYYLAPLWEAKYAKLEKERKAREAKARAKASHGSTSKGAVGPIPKELRATLKRSKGAKGLLQDLEEQVRSFVKRWEDKEKARLRREKEEDEGLPEPDSEDDEVVFVGRNGAMSDMRAPRAPQSQEEEVRPEQLILEGFEDDHGGRFARWLLHSIGNYYGLRTWSVAHGNPVRREAYVGIKEVKLKSSRRSSFTKPMPRPLYALV